MKNHHLAKKIDEIFKNSIKRVDVVVDVNVVINVDVVVVAVVDANVAVVVAVVVVVVVVVDGIVDASRLAKILEIFVGPSVICEINFRS